MSRPGRNKAVCLLKPLLHRTAFFVRPLCNQERHGTLGRRRMVAWIAHRLFPGVIGNAMDAMVARMFKHASYTRSTVAKDARCCKVAQRRQKRGRHIAMVAEGTHSGRCVRIWRCLCHHHCHFAFLLRPVYLLTLTTDNHLIMTMATIVPRFCNY